MLHTSRLLALALCCTLVACSGGASNSRLDYKEAKGATGLDVPPDLVAPENSGETELPAAKAIQILPSATGIHVVHDGIERWLVLDEPVEQLWPRLRSFWATLGLVVVLEKPELGIMETDWAENRADAPSGFLSNWVKKVFKDAYAAGTRDKYRLRLERTEGGGSELYISHYGLKEVVVSAREEYGMGKTGWEVRPADQELVNEVMNRLVLYLGGNDQLAAEAKADVPAPAPLASVEGDELIINEGFVRSWRLTGIALDRLGVVVEDRNRAQGIYYVAQIELTPQEEQKGWFSSLFAPKAEKKGEQPQLQIVLHGDEGLTRLTILNMDGTPRHDVLAKELLKRLQQELK